MAWKNDQVSQEETKKIIELAKRSLEVKGDFVEMGCYKGDTSLLLAEVLNDFNKDMTKCDLKKRLWIYDSFEGLPEKRLEDDSVLGEAFRAGELGVTKRDVKERFLRAGLPVPVIKKGWFSDLTEKDMPKEIALAFLDGDFYESIKDSLKLVIPKMNKNGVVIVHDYTNLALPGVKKAVDELSRKEKMIINTFILL
ncbi:class I SAM-dependent methyltransferase [Candidatus Saccharibacteria bacterium]|nr:class I SAM-dependent methyltransferase [Candidatus Saccharibacteria bacterium]